MSAEPPGRDGAVAPLALADALLFVLALRGAACAFDLAPAVGADEARVASEIARLGAAGLVERRTVGARDQLVLTPDGRTRASAVVAAERACLGVAVAAIDVAFAALNRRVKQTLLRWQVRVDGTTEVPNDHADPRHDRAVLDDLQALQASADELLADLGSLRPRYASLRRRLRDATTRALAGDRTAVAGVRGDSVHAVWWELHADLLAVLGRARGDADA